MPSAYAIFDPHRTVPVLNKNAVDSSVIQKSDVWVVPLVVNITVGGVGAATGLGIDIPSHWSTKISQTGKGTTSVSSVMMPSA